MSEEAAKFLVEVVTPIVEYPEAVQVDHIVDERGVLLTLTVHPTDVRHVIGKEGATAQALRLILKIWGGRRNARVAMKITDPRPLQIGLGAFH